MFIRFEDFQDIGLKRFESVTAATTSAVKRFQPIAAEAFHYSSKSLTNGSSLAEKLLKVSKPDEIVELQLKFLKVAMEDLFVSSTKIAKLYSELAEEAFKAFANGGITAITEETAQKRLARAADQDAPKEQVVSPPTKDAPLAQSTSLVAPASKKQS